MPAHWNPWEVVGWLANACYFSRFFVQWIASERASESVAPALFWWLSLFGVVGFGLYSHHIGEPVLVAGALVNGLIYVRNLMLVHKRPGFRIGPAATAGLAILALYLVLSRSSTVQAELTSTPGWFACSIIGQGIWSSRFVLQWWLSEREGRTHFPRSFWWLSLLGNLLLLLYAIHLRNAVLVAGFSPGPLVQARNLMISYRRSGPAMANTVDQEQARA